MELFPKKKAPKLIVFLWRVAVAIMHFVAAYSVKNQKPWLNKLLKNVLWGGYILMDKSGEIKG
jgi:hypothetical protein